MKIGKIEIVFGDKDKKKNEKSKKIVDNKPSLFQKIVAWIVMIYSLIMIANLISYFSISEIIYVIDWQFLFTLLAWGISIYAFIKIIIKKQKPNKVVFVLVIIVNSFYMLGTILILALLS
jgi:hypothetical protein